MTTFSISVLVYSFNRKVHDYCYMIIHNYPTRTKVMNNVIYVLKHKRRMKNYFKITIPSECDSILPTITYKMFGSWVDSNEELMQACQRFQICDEQPEQIAYTPFESILQDGPQCGLIALAMYLKLSKQEINELIKIAQSLNFTFNGEMFSTDDMCTLSKKYTDKKVEVYSGNLNSNRIIEFLLNQGILLVPYDADANHSPCNKDGHKAHWALVSGIIISDDTYVIARQGKSRYLGIWPLEELAQSNLQLNEFSPARKHSNLTYKLPEDGIAGPKGLCGKCVLIYNEL